MHMYYSSINNVITAATLYKIKRTDIDNWDNAATQQTSHLTSSCSIDQTVTFLHFSKIIYY